MVGESDMLVPVEERLVDFHGDTITAAIVPTLSGPAIYVPVRPLCNYLGLDWSAQYRRILRDPVLSEAAQGVAITTTPSVSGSGGGTQRALALPLEMLHGWLFGVNANRVKPQHREALIRYQRDCYRVLWDALRPASPATLEARVSTIEGRLEMAAAVVGDLRRRLTGVERHVAPGHPISEEQAAELNLHVRALGELLRSQGGGGSRPQQLVWSELYRRWGVASYHHLPAADYAAVRAWLDEWRHRVAAG